MWGVANICFWFGTWENQEIEEEKEKKYGHVELEVQMAGSDHQNEEKQYEPILQEQKWNQIFFYFKNESKNAKAFK